MIEELMVNIGDAVYNKISDTEVVRGSENKDVEKAWKLYNEALDEWDMDKFEKAVKEFKKAVDRVEDAVEN